MADLTTIGFGEVAFDDAIKALRTMLPMSDAEFGALSEVAKQRAFSFTGAYSDSAANAVQKVLLGALDGSISRDEFLARANAALEPFGLDLSAFQANTIFETVLSKVYGQGKDAEYRNPVFRANNPYIGWVTAHDNRVRPNHFALDYRRIQTVFPMDDFLWSVWHEPAGFRCRCTRMAFSEARVAELGLQIGKGHEWYGKSVEVTTPGGISQVVQVLPDPGFGAGALTGKATLLRVVGVLAILMPPAAPDALARRLKGSLSRSRNQSDPAFQLST